MVLARYVAQKSKNLTSATIVTPLTVYLPKCTCNVFKSSGTPPNRLDCADYFVENICLRYVLARNSHHVL